ncbi:MULTISPECIES: C-GCAxxG-C-C family protein [unclassified Halanaerobium]|uniref:C-GCAxxG-C-C family protein n=1 Tax=unclassified Halanaerobium TaxID=2641197 RepID=UPI000DF373A6|nr:MULTISPECIES: C-GCAxxG-C-C family protein [unclassified Halanaerobium]RCW46350.1 C_GCAxxG_C_C family probable redox protein [Halanaerobium sp. MA284_MarDTE_T2]RCW82515.1 C_GCAxxG_C_C family probable redox protein [Halanaerobium sp. DL-01]
MENSERKELLDSIYKRAYEYEADYGFCPQAVLAALQDYFDGIDDEVIKANHTLAGGGALCGDGTCGGLVGGMAALGCFFGRSREEFGKSSADGWTGSSKIAKKLREKFIDEFGSVICNDVQSKKMGRSFDLWDQDDFRKFEEAGAHEDQCPDVTGKSAMWTAEILLDRGIEIKK